MDSRRIVLRRLTFDCRVEGDRHAAFHKKSSQIRSNVEKIVSQAEEAMSNYSVKHVEFPRSLSIAEILQSEVSKMSKIKVFRGI
jgi:hypothetical protein